MGSVAGYRALAVAGGWLALTCSTPHYDFIPDAAVEHCANHRQDSAWGESDIDCGGKDCHGCGLGRGCADAGDCAEGDCIGGLCQEPGCDNRALDGDETGVDCGGSCKPCRDGQPCRTASDCGSRVCDEDGVCASATCTDGVQNGDELGVDCGGSFCDDGCGVGTSCAMGNDCESGLCDETTKTCALNCPRGTDECDGNLDDPCETNLLVSTGDCGACGNACKLPHARPACSGGTCQIDTCEEPWIHCNTDSADGCEVDASSDVMNCGGCGMVCPSLHGTPRCVSSKCTIDCEPGFADCDGDPRTGCEASIADVNDCGACGNSCPDTEGVPNCVQGKCGHTDCVPGLGDCDGDRTCETSLSDDPKNCGRCGNVCSTAHAKSDCVLGTCVIVSCDDGWDDCDAGDSGYATGCETNLAADAKNCGACGKRCDAVAHGAGSCQAGACALSCDTGFEDCDGKVETGCETDTTSDPANCGGCDNVCRIPNAKAACEGSRCVIDRCDAPFMDCNAAAGCETDVSSSAQHCGSCTASCSSAGATQVSCKDGACEPPVCDASHLSCNGNNDDGCETDITTAANCGACGNVCSGATPTCVQSGAAYACQAKITLGGSTAAQAAAGSISFGATPRAGTNRLMLLTLVSDSQTNNVSHGLEGARPGSVQFGNQAMVAGPSQVGTNDPWSPDLFVYYLPLGDSPADQPSLTVSLGGSSGPANVMIVGLLQLDGARQSAPITAFAGGFIGTPDPNDPAVTAAPLAVATSGSAIVSFVSDYWDTRSCPAGAASSGCPAWSVNPATNLTTTETMASTPFNFYPPNSGNAPIRAFGMLVTAASPALPQAGSYTPRWSDPNPGRFTYLSLAVAPAQAP